MEHKKAIYKTKQGNVVQEYLRENAGRHVTVEEIRRNARNGERPISTATIYRQRARGAVRDGSRQPRLLRISGPGAAEQHS